MLLGEAHSKCEHLAGAPLRPDVAQELYRVTLIKGALATTAIEGNTLTEEQVAGLLDGTFEAPRSRQYQEQEVRNVIEALTDMANQVAEGQVMELSTALICDFNRQVLKDLDTGPDVVPGEIRTHSVGVANYRGAPAEDIEYLLDTMVEWLNGPTFQIDDPELQFALTLTKAVYAHLYLAWIHPFGDGNGRTARLVEFLILASCGLVPLPAAHLLSNHYNLTREQYYRELAKASATGGETLGFLVYAIQGFVDGIREAILMVREQQIRVTWINYVYERFEREPRTKATDRQRTLVLGMPMDRLVARGDLEGLTPKIARLYANAGPRVLSRDLNHLVKLGLLRKAGKSYGARSSVVLAFLPPMADTGQGRDSSTVVQAPVEEEQMFPVPA